MLCLSRGVGNGNPLQCSCLENLRGRGVWWAAVYGVAQSQTRLKRLGSSSSSSSSSSSRSSSALLNVGSCKSLGSEKSSLSFHLSLSGASILLLDFVASLVPQSSQGVVTADTCESQAPFFSLVGTLPAQKFTFGGRESLMVLWHPCLLMRQEILHFILVNYDSVQISF